ncbi:MAG: hypothetical protein ACRCXZ_04455 [Patescibacteria group bacterium]
MSFLQEAQKKPALMLKVNVDCPNAETNCQGASLSLIFALTKVKSGHKLSIKKSSIKPTKEVDINNEDNWKEYMAFVKTVAKATSLVIKKSNKALSLRIPKEFRCEKLLKPILIGFQQDAYLKDFSPKSFISFSSDSSIDSQIDLAHAIKLFLRETATGRNSLSTTVSSDGINYSLQRKGNSIDLSVRYSKTSQIKDMISLPISAEVSTNEKTKTVSYSLAFQEGVEASFMTLLDWI